MSKPYADSKVHIEKLEKRKPKPRTENHLVPLEKSHPSPSKKCGSQQDSYITRFGDPQMKQAIRLNRAKILIMTKRLSNLILAKKTDENKNINNDIEASSPLNNILENLNWSGNLNWLKSMTFM